MRGLPQPLQITSLISRVCVVLRLGLMFPFWFPRISAPLRVPLLSRLPGVNNSMPDSVVLLQAFPGLSVREHGSRRPLLVSGCSPTDTLQYTLMSAGMGKRLGESNRSPTALQYDQLRWILRFRSSQWMASAPAETRYMLAATIVAELTGWLGWLRGGELFGLERADVSIIPPARGMEFDLPPEVGMVLLKLDPATKASQTRQADMTIAYLTWSGIAYGRWVRRLLRAMNDLGCTTGPLFRQVGMEKPWDSSFYRYTFLYPALRWLRDNGMISLRRFDDSPGMSVEEWFYSMGFLRRGVVPRFLVSVSIQSVLLLTTRFMNMVAGVTGVRLAGLCPNIIESGH
eukprot:scaffold119933_cov29-Attheya_sp.AAC.1